MPVQANARDTTVFFQGGSVTAPLGLWKALFATDPGLLGLFGSDKQVDRKAHQRIRVIGGPATAVGQTVYTRRAVKRGKRGGAAGGEPVLIYAGESPWTARLFGSHQDFCRFWENMEFPMIQTVNWRSEKGTPYGPFNNDNTTPGT